MKDRYIHFNVEDINPIIFCGKPIMWEWKVDGGYEIPYEIEPTFGEHDFNKCNECQKTLKILTARLTERFNGNVKKAGFPLCCKYHANLVKVPEFKRESFVNVPKMVAEKVVYTYQHIRNNLLTDNYYKEITDYIDCVVESFGKVPNGCGEPLYLNDYLFFVKALTERRISLSKERIEKVLEYLKAYQILPESRQSDMQLLVGTYEKWFKKFPFELTYFAHLKEHYQRQLPILNGMPETNKYTGFTKIKLHTKTTLIEALVNLTNDLLTKINSLSLYEKGLLTEPQKIKLELILSERKAKLKKGYKNDSQDESTRYRKMLKAWFKDEKKFIDEITPLLQNLTKPDIETHINEPSQLPSKEPKIREILAFLGNDHPQAGQLLSQAEFERLVRYVVQMMETKTVPQDIEPINATNLPAEIIRYAIYCLHLEFIGKGRNLAYPYINFLKQVFSNKFDEWTDDTLRKKFSEKPNSWEYWSNIEG